ncbi:MAG: osmoprotectant transport system permease protein [Solirubrobacteraceae bacterium]|nr:osmoprotectant transport system permease protein [Solirubrobacteraceae bacterium]
MSYFAAGGPVIPNFGGGSSSFACERANRLFCTHWLSQNWDSVLWPALRQHVVLTVIAVSIGFVVSTTLAVIAHRRGWVERPVLIITSILYTIPSLALFEILQGVPGFGLSATTAEVALVSYTLLIMFRNTLTGLREVPDEVRDAAAGMGFGPSQTLLRVELPLALPAIIAGVRIATVTVISLATVASLVDNEGLGVPILSAISNNVFKTELISAGVLAVALALLSDALLIRLQRRLTPWSRAS